jgi:hypothetical protein
MIITAGGDRTAVRLVSVLMSSVKASLIIFGLVSVALCVQ